MACVFPHQWTTNNLICQLWSHPEQEGISTLQDHIEITAPKICDIPFILSHPDFSCGCVCIKNKKKKKKKERGEKETKLPQADSLKSTSGSSLGFKNCFFFFLSFFLFFFFFFNLK